MKNFTKSLLLLLLMMSFFEVMAQKKVYVDASNANKVASTLDGTTWAKAYASLEVAITKNLITNNVEYYIAEGTYIFSNNSFYYTNASFFGGYKTGGSDTPDRLKYFTNVEKATIGFELKKTGTQYVKNIIFGISDLDVVSTKVFRGNGGEESMQSKFGLPIEFSDCLFFGCKFNSNIGNVSLSNNEFRQCINITLNSGEQKISNCTFKDGFGSGIMTSNSNLKINDCLFENNQESGVNVIQSNFLEIVNTKILKNQKVGLNVSSSYQGFTSEVKLSGLVVNNNLKNGIFLGGTMKFDITNLDCSFNKENGIYLYIFDEDKNYTKINQIKQLISKNNGVDGLNIYYNNGTLDLIDGDISNNGGFGINQSNSRISRLNFSDLIIQNNKLSGIRSFGSQSEVKLKNIDASNNFEDGVNLGGRLGLFDISNCKFNNNIIAGLRLSTESGFQHNVIESQFENNSFGLTFGGTNLQDIINIKKCKFFNNELKKEFSFNNTSYSYPFSSAIHWWGGQLKIDATEFTGNKSKGKNSGVEGNGGAIFNYLGNTVITNSFFHDNTATGAGGAIFSEQSGLSIYNSVFTQNISSNQGGAVMVSGKQTRDTEIINCTFFDNRTYDLDGGGAVSNNSTKAINIKNSIFYKNKQNKANNIFSSDIYAKTGTLNVNSTALQLDSLKYKTTANINFNGKGNYYNKDPKFLLPAYLEDSAKAYLKGADNLFGTKDDALRLRSDSPFLNIGVNSFNATTENPSGLDVAGNVRIQDFVIDLGAYEGGIKVVHSIPLPTEKVIAEGSSATITLATLTDYGNPVTYALVSGPATLKDNVLTPTGKPGKIVVTGKANGTEKDVTISICVNPSKPTITMRDIEGDFFLKSSTTTGNVWYNNDKKTTLTTQDITAIYDSFYTLQIDVEGCVSAFSDKIVIPKDKVHTIGTVTLTDLKEGNEKTIDLPIKTDFGNTVNYTITGPAIIANGKLTVGSKPGLVQIVGKANKAAKDVNYKFCVLPNKPTITLINNSDVYKIKSSSTDGNVWYKNDTKITNTAQEISADYEATYKLQIDLSGCLSEQSEKITIPKLIILGIENGSDDDIILYPNPLSNELTVKSQSYVSKLSLKIIDINGRMVLTEKYNSVSNDIKLDLTNLASGTYLIELETNKIKIIKKIIKQ